MDIARINRYILDRLPGRDNIYISANEGATPEDNDIYRPEYWYTFHKPSLLDYILKLKVETPIILIKNLQAPRLYNRTRLRVTRYGQHIIEGEIIGKGKYAGEKVLLFKTRLQSKDNNIRIPNPFIRYQYPIRPAFAMTINKSQC